MNTNLEQDVIQEELQRIIASSRFVRSPRQVELVTYLIEEVLAGRGNRIKATSIAVDVFGRDESFDQQRDTIVRVEAGRLRKHLQAYYETEGSENPVHISIPKGTYQPSVTQRSTGPAVAATQAVHPAPGAAAVPEAAGRAALYGKLLLLALVLGAIWLMLPFKRPDNDPPAVVTAVERSRPFLMVTPFATHEEDEGADRLAFGLVESLIAKLAKLQGMSVMAHASILEHYQDGRAVNIQVLHNEHGVTHVLRCSLEQVDNNVVLNMQLVDAASGATLWADRQSHPVGNLLEMEEELALELAAALSIQIQPDERARLGAAHTADTEAWVLYRQGLVMIVPPNDMTRINTARQLFHRAQQLDPQFAGGYAGESFSHSITVLFLKTQAPEKELALALPLGQRAIEADPQFAMGYAVKSFAELMSGHHDAALANARRAITLQPGDAFTRFIYGMNLTIAGQPKAALPVLREALRLDPLESRTPYLNVLGIAQYSAGLYQQALDTFLLNERRGGPRGPHMDTFIAATYAQLGNEAKARQAWQSVPTLAPEFPVENWLSMWLTREDDLDETLSLLRTLASE